MPRSVAIFANPFKKRSKKEVSRLKVWLARHKISILPSRSISQAEVIFSLGGDGTVLSLAPQAAKLGIPILGINLGRLGFLTASDANDMGRILNLWMKNQLVTSERMMLEVEAPMLKRPLIALNDAVVRTGATSRVITVDASVENESLGCFVGDGIIVSTSTGSTAYSLSASGPVVHPGMDALLLTPICAHSFTQRPVVFPAYQELCLELHERRTSDDVQLTLDGQKTFMLKNGDKVYIRKAPFKLKLLCDPEMPYFKLLREKMSWGGK